MTTRHTGLKAALTAVLLFTVAGAALFACGGKDTASPVVTSAPRPTTTTTDAGDLDLPDILYAARLAAANSKARGSSNVPVDYTRIKHVWKPRGAPAGQVHYTDQKTVFVDGTLPE